MKIIFQGYTVYWTSLFSKAALKQNVGFLDKLYCGVFVKKKQLFIWDLIMKRSHTGVKNGDTFNITEKLTS